MKKKTKKPKKLTPLQSLENVVTVIGERLQIGEEERRKIQHQLCSIQNTLNINPFEALSLYKCGTSKGWLTMIFLPTSSDSRGLKIWLRPECCKEKPYPTSIVQVVDEFCCNNRLGTIIWRGHPNFGQFVELFNSDSDVLTNRKALVALIEGKELTTKGTDEIAL